MVGILSLKGDRKEQMGVMGQGLVLMVFGMTVVYLFLWLMIVVVKHSSRFVVKFDYLRLIVHDCGYSFAA